MKTNEFLNMMLAMLGINGENYERNYFVLPRIICADGFNMSVQCGCSHYCGSENGYRKFGEVWKFLEWGFPSEPIDPEAYYAENADTINSVGSVEIEKIDELFERHGGIDIVATLSGAHKDLEDYFTRGRTRLSTL